MHPAVSIIVFSTFSGVGFGISFWLGVLGHGANSQSAVFAGIFAFGWASIGLLSSLFHLRRPTRAVRALSQWKSSWLSREGILSILTLGCISLYTALRYFDLSETGVLILSWLISLLSLITVYSTAMIYTQLKSVPAWNTFLTPLVYLGFSLVGGSTFIFSFIPELIHWEITFLNPALLVGGWVIWILWCLRRDQIGMGGSSVGTATRLGKFGTVKPFEPPHMGDNYLTREMGYRLSRRKSHYLRGIAAVTGLLVPAILYSLVFIDPELWFVTPVLILLFCFTFVGILISRWLFFAESRHTTMLYYRSE